ncbi:hypothetical protein TgHK011_001206 [Trichoderma gracile]|nr:hypothetical protein TgHK011_001206 [Trichoderma gracile]
MLLLLPSIGPGQVSGMELEIYEQRKPRRNINFTHIYIIRPSICLLLEAPSTSLSPRLMNQCGRHRINSLPWIRALILLLRLINHTRNAYHYGSMRTSHLVLLAASVDVAQSCGPGITRLAAICDDAAAVVIDLMLSKGTETSAVCLHYMSNSSDLI